VSRNIKIPWRAISTPPRASHAAAKLTESRKEVYGKTEKIDNGEQRKK
jgi:hypothetical protein